MTRPAKTPLIVLIPLSFILHAGCQRSMGGSMATGPFAPAGTAGTASAPLFPVGPINGATRVPPPPTGNASPNNGYNSPPSASNFGPNGAASAFQVNANGANLPPNEGFAASPPGQSPDAFRNSLGGMHVIDMTNISQPLTTDYAGSGFANASSATPIGSGVYDPARRPVETNSWAQQPADLLRPIDQPFAAVPVPRYRGMEGQAAPVTYLGAVQPAGGFSSSDAWQSVQPPSTQSQIAQTQPNQIGAAQGGTDQGSFGRSSIGQSSFRSPSVSNGGPVPAAQIASPNLPWRSPTTAR